MKRLTLLSIVSLLFSLNALFAQSDKFHYGLKAGINLASWKYSYDTQMKNKLLFTGHIGAFGEYEFSENLSFRAGLGLAGRGDKLTERDPGFGKWTYVVRTVDIDLPMAAIYRINKFYVGGGPNISFTLAGRWREKFESETDWEESNDLKGKLSMENANRIDIGLNFLAGYKITDKMSVEAGYGIGFINRDKHLGQHENSAKNRVLSFSLLYTLK